MVALRKHPAVSAGDDSKLDPRGLVVRRPLEDTPGHVALERDTAHDAFVDAGRSRDDAVRTVGADDEGRADDLASHARRYARVADRDLAHRGAVAKVGSRSRGLLGEMEVEPPPLRHADERLSARACDLAPVTNAYDQPVDDVLYDRLDVARHVAERSSGEPTAARLVARKARLVREQDACAGARQVDRSARPRRTCTDDEGVEPVHRAIVVSRAMRVTVLEVETPHGPARAHVHRVADPKAALVLGHGAGGGVESRDLVTARDVALAQGLTVALVEQPYRVAGRRSPAPANHLDAAWTAVVGHLSSSELRGLRLVVGGRSLGARVACRTSASTGAIGVLCLAFPLLPPRRSGTPVSRLPELDAVSVPTLVVQGERDPFGVPPAGRRRTVVVVPGDHSLRTDLDAVGAAVGGWLAKIAD